MLKMRWNERQIKGMELKQMMNDLAKAQETGNEQAISKVAFFLKYIYLSGDKEELFQEHILLHT